MSDDVLTDYTKEERAEFLIQRRNIIRKMFAKGYSNEWGFGVLVGAACEEAGIPHNGNTVFKDIQAVEKELAEDETTVFGRRRTLEVLKNELHELAVLGEDIEDNPNKRLGILNAKLKILKQIRELEGQDEPARVKHDHTHDVKIQHIIARLPDAMVEALGTVDTIPELEAILIPEIGETDTHKLLAAVSEEHEDG